MRDYYRDMDLATNATFDEIKGQYRRLAKQYHPDRNPNNPYAEQRFKEISEAYSVLSDSNKRMNYDMQRESFFNQSSHTQTRQRQQSGREVFDDFFNSPLWGAMKGFAGGVAQDFVRNLDEEIHEEYHDVDPFIERVAKIQSRHNSSGSVSVTVSISREHLREITSMASRGMDIEQFASDVGILFSASLVDVITEKWRG